MANGANGVNGAHEPPQGIFISYRREDAGTDAVLLKVLLDQYLPGTQVFRDTQSIELGADFEAAIADAIGSSAVMLVLIGSKWLTITDDTGAPRLFMPDDWVRREIQLALNSAVRVIPVLVQGVKAPPTAGELPRDISGLASRQGQRLDLLGAHERDVRYLAVAVEREKEKFASAWRELRQLPADAPRISYQTPIPDFVEHIERIRVGYPGHPANPANAMTTLRLFAYQRSIDDLLRLRPGGQAADGFAPLDAVAVLTLAAVGRPPKEAAELAVGLREAEGAPSGLTASIIHDLAAQRTVPDVAEFVYECKSLGHADLVADTVTAFVRSRSRVSLDKALLYFELDRFGLESEARALLAQTLDIEGRPPSGAVAADRGEPRRPLAGVIGEVGIVGALRHLSPSDRIVEKWIRDRMEGGSADGGSMSDLVARLLINEPGDWLLAEHVGLDWPPEPLVELCEHLAAAGGGASLALRLVRHYVARRRFVVPLPQAAAAGSPASARVPVQEQPWQSLAKIIELWHRSASAKLTATYDRLLRAIVTGGEDGGSPPLTAIVPGVAGDIGPCPIEFLSKLAGTLGSQQRRLELLEAAATYPKDRPGAEVAQLLIWVGEAGRPPARQDGTWLAKNLRNATRQVGVWFDGDLWRVAQQVNEWYARGLEARTVEPAVYIDYLTELEHHPTLTFWAMRELTDPAASKGSEPRRGEQIGEQIGDIAVSIYVGGLPDIAFDLLERYLENEQAVEPEDVKVIAGKVKDYAEMRGDRWKNLLGATIGRWTDTSKLNAVLEKLRENGQDGQYALEAQAIMRLSQ